MLYLVSSITAAAIAVVSVVLYRRYNTSNRAGRLPPGPRALPFFGNIHQLPRRGLHDVFMAWGNRYGDLLHARIFNTSLIIVNSMEIAQDLLVKRSSIYSSRPYSVLYDELMGWNNILSGMPYGDRFRKHRKWIHDVIQEKESLWSYRPLQRREVDILIEGIKATPREFVANFQRYTSALVMEVAYGHTVTSSNDKYINMIEAAVKITSETGVPGCMIVDFFPILKHLPTWVPGSGFKSKALSVRPYVRQVMDVPIEMVKSALANGTARPSLVATLLEQNDAEEEDIKGAGAVLYGAATITSVSLLSSFILAMVIHPAVYAKAQNEVDRVVEAGDLPGFEDRESLPYLECVLREVYRWNVPLPLGLPHSVIDDDEYHGYYIPNGTRVLANIAAMSKDAKFYPEPHLFRPERFEEMDPATLEERDPRKFVFGFGRRACPGMQFADTSIWLAIAHMVATLDICKAHDAAGNEITPAAKFTSDVDSHPEPFVCDIHPRIR